MGAGVCVVLPEDRSFNKSTYFKTQKTSFTLFSSGMLQTF